MRVWKQAASVGNIIVAISGLCEVRRSLGYADPDALPQWVIADLQTAIRVHFPDDVPPDPLGREASEHEAFAEVRRHTYIGRNSYFKRLDDHAAGDRKPLVMFARTIGEELMDDSKARRK
jgi:hypothetical protein